MKGLASLAVGLTLAIALMVPYRIGAAADCGYALGFAALREMIPDQVGDCVVDEQYDAETGHLFQETTGGLLFWRKADNFTAFTDGYHTWVIGPFGLEQRLNTERFEWEPTDPQMFTLTSADLPDGFTLDDARYTSNEMVASQYDDSQAALAMLHSLGRVDGYYIRFDAHSATEAGGFEFVTSQAAVFSSPEGAQDYMEHYRVRLQDIPPQSYTLETVPLDRIGDEAGAVRYVSQGSSVTDSWIQYNIFFRKGPVFAVVYLRVSSLSGEDIFEEGVGYARVMEERIR
ncbi:MAG: hypothetical protein HY675_04655 [Chloroflexi bacterium]|nr:hypothetical protein [Chloroflexota bacterium]